MNYTAHYERLIERARHRVFEGYRERHHVVPVCMGGTNALENIVELTPEEHYVGHQLLVKIFPGNAKLAYAAMAMAKRAVGHQSYGWLRRSYAASLIGVRRAPFSAEHRANISAAHLGRQMSAETRKKMSLGKRGNTNSKGKPRSIAHIAALRAGYEAKARYPSQEVREKISASKIGRKHSPDAIMKMAAVRSAWWQQRRAA